VANISHDLRTPLSAILGMTDAALSSKDPEVYRETLEGILESGKNLSHLIEDILNYASIEHKQTQNDQTTFDLEEFIGSTRLATEPNAHKKGLRLIIDNQCQPNQFVHADKKSLRRIIVNLIGNAIKFTDKGHITLTLSQGTANELSPELMTLNIAIQDTGIGMKQHDLGKIFNRFSRLSPTYSSGQTSSGLGLTIVQQLLLQLHGTIDVESTPGIGTTFYCKIPLQFVDAPQVPKKLANTDDDILLPNEQQRIINILVVEDSEPVRRAMNMLLKNIGAQVTFANTGKEAITMPINRFDMVFMDVGLGETSGIEVTKTLRDKHGHGTPIVALTAHAQEKDRQNCLEAGMNDFLTKPVLLDTLKKLLHSFDLY
jgi:CheY-like chemotaxis protein